MADEVSIPKTKPKRELTEAQKLAFLKGREKRLANIEKKRLEKEEAAANTTEAKIVTPTKQETPPQKQKPDPVPETQPAPVASFDFDMDALADKVAERILKAQPVPAPKPKAPTRPRPTPPPQQFTWL